MTAATRAGDGAQPKSEEDLVEAVARTLLRVLNKVQADRRVARTYGSGQPLTMLESEVCALIGDEPGRTGGDLAEAMGVTPSAVSQVVTKLSGKELIRVERDPANERIKHLYLTPSGVLAATDIRQHYQQMTSSILGGSSKRDLQATLAFVSQLEGFLDDARARR